MMMMMLMMISLLQTQGRFQWVDNWKLSFTKWGPDEPKINYGCVYMDVDRKWKMAECSETHYSLCKKSPRQSTLRSHFQIDFIVFICLILFNSNSNNFICPLGTSFVEKHQCMYSRTYCNCIVVVLW